MPRLKILQYIVLVLFAALFIFHALSLSFTQDDAFISYRYVKNFLRGDGLVFNPGERVEGYTNPFFIFIMILLGRLGIDIIIASKIIGLASGLFIIILAFIWIRKTAGFETEFFLPLAVPFLLIANTVLAYWAISGMETVFFAALILFGLYLAAGNSLLFIPVLALATLTRPEGGLVFVTVLTYLSHSGLMTKKNALGYLLLYVLLIIPQAAFRLTYYHDILPNPFYAKTGWSFEYLKSGVEYVWLFLKQYGLYGGIIIIPLWAAKYFDRPIRLILTVSIVYVLYIMLIGGDVLHCQRFFIPVMALFYILLVISLARFAENSIFLRRVAYRPYIIAIIFIIGVVSFIAPAASISGFLDAEKGLVNKMTHQAFILRPYARRQSLIACTTVGAFSYYSDARVIDMLGLTDRTIARNPQIIERIQSTWKERNYNTPYIMQQDPDFIFFSTGMKPSAPAEKALFLSSEFRQGYYPVFSSRSGMEIIYRRRPDYNGRDEYFPDPTFIDFFAEAINSKGKNDYETAFIFASQSLIHGPPDFYLPLSIMGTIQLEFGDMAEGVKHLREALEKSGGYATLSGDYLARFYEAVGDTVAAEEIYRNLLRINRLD